MIYRSEHIKILFHDQIIAHTVYSSSTKRQRLKLHDHFTSKDIKIKSAHHMLNFILTAFNRPNREPRKTADTDILFIDCILLFSGLQLQWNRRKHHRVEEVKVDM